MSIVLDYSVNGSRTSIPDWRNGSSVKTVLNSSHTRVSCFAISPTSFSCSGKSRSQHALFRAKVNKHGDRCAATQLLRSISLTRFFYWALILRLALSNGATLATSLRRF